MFEKWKSEVTKKRTKIKTKLHTVDEDQIATKLSKISKFAAQSS